LSQAIYNVLTNAYKFTRDNGYVKISYNMDSEDLVIRIDDNGIGIAKEELDRIFEAYYRSSTTTDFSGDGIGLYIAKENLHKIHGTIQVSSNLNVGSSFVITIPKNISNY